LWFDGYKPKEISQLLYISEATIKRILHYYKLWKCVNNPFKEKKGRKKIFNNNDMNVSILSLYIFFYYNIITNVNWYLYKVLIQLINERKDWFLDELIAEMTKKTFKTVSISTLWRSLECCGITRKKVFI
jgi:hypothetical protein